MDLSEIRRAITAMNAPLDAVEPMTLDEWASEHFYLSAESSYVEQRWRAWPFQRAIMACISNDDIREIIWRKSARVGYTKIILAAVGYHAQHKRRNQALWQPTDDDRDEFVKTELDTMLRDVRVMESIFPAYLARHKDNTLQQKKFIGSMLHLRGGKAAKNYRRISVDVAYLDEIDGFDTSIEKEGDPVDLAAKRIEGATFPKLIVGSTPKHKGFSIIEKRERQADLLFTYRVPCPHCGGFHALTFGGRDDPHGLKWSGKDPQSVRHLCPHCGALIAQAEYLNAWETGRHEADNGITCDHAGIFRDPSGAIIRPPDRVAFHTWSAYSPSVPWPNIVADFLAAAEAAQTGQKEKLQTFTNTTLGEYWALEMEGTDEDELRARAEPFPLERCPMGCLLLLAGIDTQDNRLEVVVWGYGRGCETWTIAYRVFFGNPQEDEVWHDLEDFLFETEFPHESGATLRISGAAQDTKGHNSHAVYHFAARHARRRFFAVAGRSGREKHIRDGASKVDIDWRGRVRKSGLILWWVGTNHAKDLIHGRLQLTRPGPGYIHFSRDLPDEFYKQLTGEARTTRMTTRGEESAWTAIRKRVEVLDCTVYAVWLETYFELSKKSAKYWDDLEAKVQPAVKDLFAENQGQKAIPQDPGPPPPPRPLARRIGRIGGAF